MAFLPNQIIVFLPTRKHNIFFLTDRKQIKKILRCQRQTFFSGTFLTLTLLPKICSMCGFPLSNIWH